MDDNLKLERGDLEENISDEFDDLDGKEEGIGNFDLEDELIKYLYGAVIVDLNEFQEPIKHGIIDERKLIDGIAEGLLLDK